MPRVVYVTEYEPSSASLRIGGSDPIYRASSGQETLAVGAQTPLILLGLAGLGALVIYFLARD